VLWLFCQAGAFSMAKDFLSLLTESCAIEKTLAAIGSLAVC
jgi:hypothetical protein